MAASNLNMIKRSLTTIYDGLKCINVPCRRRHSAIWTQEKTVKSAYKDVIVPNCPLYEYVWQNLEKWPERTLSVCGETGRGYTYELGFKLSNTFAANLRTKLKIRDGDAVAVMLPNIPDFPVVAMGILEAGAIITTINPIYTPHEIQRQLFMSDVKSIVTLPELVDTIKEALKIAKINIPIIVVKTKSQPTPEGTLCFNELSEDVYVDKSCLKEVRRTGDDVCFLPYSSGTTGMPKGVELTNKNLTVNCEQINEESIRCHNETTATHQDAVMTVLPFFHIYAATVLMFHKMSKGIKLVTLSKMQPDIYFNALEKQKTNLLFAAPPLILMMASHPAGSPKVFQHLEIVINGAAPLSKADAYRFVDKAQRKIDFRQGYGLTETSPTVSLTPRGFENFSTVGVPIPNCEIKVVDSNMNHLGPGEKGELLVRGPQVMKGYRNNPQANNEVFTADRWFKTGDMAFIDEDGFVTIADRLKELIKVKGFQVPPAELEGLLREHSAVNDAAVIGVPHSKFGEVPKAFVVLKDGQEAKSEEIIGFVNTKVASYKRIDDIVFIDSIPKSAAGKILRKILKEKYC